MSKINNAMIEAMKSKTPKTLSNTAITLAPNAVIVTLHGNKIATLYDSGLLVVTWAGWPTSTTTTRLNTIIQAFIGGKAKAQIKNGKPLLTLADGKQYVPGDDMELKLHPMPA